jgi:AcrR family transcriptional regulator
MELLMADTPVSELKQRMPAAARRSQLLEVALDRFGAKGFHDTSMEDIADAAGVTKPVLYQHFHSKQELYMVLLDTVGDELLAEVTARAAAEESPHQRLLAGFRAYFEFVCEKESAFLLLFGGGARLDDQAAESVRRLEAGMAVTIGRFIDADIDAEHRDLLGYAIVGLGEVAARRWVDRHENQAELDRDEGEAMAVRLADLVWAGLRGLPGVSRRQAQSG